MFWHKRSAEDFAEEIKTHLELEAEDLKREGLSDDEARWKARREFGNVRRAQEQFYVKGRFVWLDSLLHDLRFALRQLRRSPGFAVTAVLTLALGIAANVIVFGVLQAMVLRSLDVPHADRVMTLGSTGMAFPVLSYPEARDVRDDSTVFSAVAANTVQNFGLEADGITRPVWGYEVSGQYFQVVGIKPLLGRLLGRSDDDHPGASESAVLSWPAWKNYFGANPNVVGKIVRINKHPYTIVGVTPEGFYGTERFLQPDLFVPMANEASLEGVNWLEDRRNKGVFTIVRLKDGVTLARAQADLKAVATRITRQYPKEEEKLGFILARPGLVGDYLGGPARAFLAGVMGLAGIVLLAACANLGSLFAARTADRTREIAIRMAIGSSRWRIVRQILVEASVISILGGVCACGLSWIALTGLATWRPPTEYPMKFSVMPQPSLILMTLLIAVCSGILFGVMPLRQIFHADPNDAIKNGGGQASIGGRRWALRDVLLAAQIALCCVTITAAFVSLRGLGRTMKMDLGIKPQHAVLTRFELSQAGYSSEAADRFQRQLLERVSQLPGVKAAGYANTPPFGDVSTSSIFSEETTDLKPSNEALDSYIFDVSPKYFDAAGTRLLAGRDVSFTDTTKTPAVAVVNQEFVRRLFHSDNGLGRYFKNRRGVKIQIVGIVVDGRYLSFSENLHPAAFYPTSQEGSTSTSIIVRPQGDTAAMETAVRKLIRDLDPTIPIRESSEWRSQLAMNFFPSQVATIALGLFGAFGLLLSIAGTFGLASYTVSKRMRELSIRVALGAQAKQILSAALGRMLLLLASGSVVGLLLGVAASRLLSAIVYQATAQDPYVLAAVALTLLLTGAVSVAGPVRRALHVDPANVLREQ
jgi:predicted permease